MVVITDRNGIEHTLTIFEPTLTHLAESAPSTNTDNKRRLLMAPPHRFMVSSTNVVYGMDKL